MPFPHVSAPPTARSPRVASVVRGGVLALIALIVGSMFAYDLVRSSPQTPLPRPRPSAGASAVLAAHPLGALASHAAVFRAPIWSAPSP
jgi:hypothetical protein